MDSRPWIVYWILHALELLDALPEEKLDRTIGAGCLADDSLGGSMLAVSLTRDWLSGCG